MDDTRKQVAEKDIIIEKLRNIAKEGFSNNEKLLKEQNEEIGVFI